jgi:hypothetical protein
VWVWSMWGLWREWLQICVTKWCTWTPTLHAFLLTDITQIFPLSYQHKNYIKTQKFLTHRSVFLLIKLHHFRIFRSHDSVVTDEAFGLRLHQQPADFFYDDQLIFTKKKSESNTCESLLISYCFIPKAQRSFLLWPFNL